jgi:predicted amidohydrolase YtcJ
MNLIFRVIYLMFIASLSMSFSSCSNRQAADLLIRGGQIYTMAENESKVEAVVVNDEKIVYAGSNAGSEQFIGPKTHIFELGGKTVLPGLIDSHAHLHSLGRFLSELILTGTTNSEQIRDMVQNEIVNASPGTWISGRGWDQNDWEVKQFPTWQDLAGTEANPVYLRRVDEPDCSGVMRNLWDDS